METVMPLHNHFVAPLRFTHPWSGFHGTWATMIARQLNQDILPPGFYAIPTVELGGPVEIDGKSLSEMTPGGFTAAANYRIEMKYANGVTMVVSNELPNGLRFEGTDGWLWVTRGAYAVTVAVVAAGSRLLLLRLRYRRQAGLCRPYPSSDALLLWESSPRSRRPPYPG